MICASFVGNLTFSDANSDAKPIDAGTKIAAQSSTIVRRSAPSFIHILGQL